MCAGYRSDSHVKLEAHRCQEELFLSLESILERNSLLHSRLISACDFVTKILSGQVPENLQAVQTAQDFYTDHGLPHLQRVIKKLDALMGLLANELNERECFLLLMAAYFHDLGMFLGRRESEDPRETRRHHHERGADLIQRLVDEKYIDLNRFETPVVKNLVLAHRIVDLLGIPEDQNIQGFKIRTRLLAAFLRIADACDVDYSRAPEAVFRFYEKLIPQVSREHWQRHALIADVCFDPRRSSIVVSMDLSGEFVDRIDRARMANAIHRELEEELDSASEVFRSHGISLVRVEVRDHVEGTYMKFSEFRRTDDCIILGIASNTQLTQILWKLIQPFVTRDKGPVLVVEVRPPEGPLFIDTRQLIEPAHFSNFQKAVGQVDGIVYCDFRLTPKEIVVVR